MVRDVGPFDIRASLTGDEPPILLGTSNSNGRPICLMTTVNRRVVEVLRNEPTAKVLPVYATLVTEQDLVRGHFKVVATEAGVEGQLSPRPPTQVDRRT